MDHEQVEAVPAFVPARMVNEFVYCPRFFYLAWVAGETGENDLTVEGKWIHRRVDVAAGNMPSADGGDFKRATSVTVSSSRLGAIAKADIVEGRDGMVVPIEMKRGKPKDVDHPVWEPERIQLALIALILRDNGYNVEYGEVQFAEARDRVRVDLTTDLVEKVEATCAELRAVAGAELPPPPLVDSPKCPTCIMSGACLPDEQNLIRERSQRPPRRLIPADTAAAPLYVSESGTRIGLDHERLIVKKERTEVAAVRLIDVSQVSIFGNVQISTQAIRELMSREIPVCWFSYNGYFAGVAEGLPGKNVALRRAQHLVDDQCRLAVASRMVGGKILNARALLMRNTKNRDDHVIREMKRLAVLAEKSDSFDRLLGLEGGAAKLYFSQFSTMIREASLGEFEFTKRNRRPPTDSINCLLSYVYSLLIKDCTTTLLGVGFDPYVGVYHRPRFGRPALALDLAEEFRPLIADSVVLTLVNNGEIGPNEFVRRGGAVSLTSDGRRAVITAYERRIRVESTHPTFGYKISYRRALEVQSRLLGAVLTGEFDEYRAVVTR